MKTLYNEHLKQAMNQNDVQLSTGKNVFEMTHYERETLREYFGKTVDTVKVINESPKLPGKWQSDVTTAEAIPSNLSIFERAKLTYAAYQSSGKLNLNYFTNFDNTIVSSLNAVGGALYVDNIVNPKRVEIDKFPPLTNAARIEMIYESRAKTLSHEFFHLIEPPGIVLRKEKENINYPDAHPYAGMLESKPDLLKKYNNISGKEWVQNPGRTEIDGTPILLEQNANAFAKKYYDETYRRYAK